MYREHKPFSSTFDGSTADTEGSSSCGYAQLARGQVPQSATPLPRVAVEPPSECVPPSLCRILFIAEI